MRIARGSERQTVDRLLAGNTNNRNVKRDTVLFYKNEILTGRWKLTNQGVGVTASGILGDGQHRLIAIQELGYPDVEFILAEGLEEDFYLFVDRGVGRTAADLLKLAFDLDLAGRFGSVLTLAIKIETGRTYGKISPADLMSTYERIGYAVSFVYSIEKAQRLAAPYVLAIANTYDETGCANLAQFTEQVVRGEMLKAGDPALALRNFIEKDNGRSGGGDVQLDRYAKAKNAAEAFVENRPITILRAKKL